MHSTNIEQAQERVDALRRELKEEVTSEVRANLRRREWRRMALRCGGCCGVYALGLLATVLVLGYGVARTGLVEVPFFSAHVAHDRTPTRVVAVADARDFERVLSERFARSFRGGRPPTTIAIPFSEGELTAFFRQALAGAGMPWARAVPDAQVSLNADHLELFARVPGVGVAIATVRVSGVPAVRDGRLTLDVREVAIGRMGIPRFLARPLVDLLLGRLPPLELPSDRGGPRLVLHQIALGDGLVTLTLNVSPAK